MRASPRLSSKRRPPFSCTRHRLTRPSSTVLRRYKEGGPAAAANFDAGVAGFESRAFRGCGIFTAEPFEVSDDAESIQMLTRSTQIGEFYIMRPPPVSPGGSADDKKFTADILIYDEERDMHVRITWLDALKATGVSGAGKGIKVDTTAKTVESAAAGDVIGFAKGASADDVLDKGDSSSTDCLNTDTWLTAALAIAQYSTFGEGAFASLKQDCNILIARPFIEHYMHSAVLAVSGRDTGATLFGPADVQLAANVQVKTIEGYACNFKLTCPYTTMTAHTDTLFQSVPLLTS